MFRKKPRVNKITPERPMLDDWNTASKILIFNIFFACNVQVTFFKNPTHNNKFKKNKIKSKLASYF